MTGEEFYRKRMDETKWPENDLCDPPTDPRTAMHILIDHFLGEDGYVMMPENDDQIITVAVAEILNKYPKNPFSAFIKKKGNFLKNKKRKGDNKMARMKDLAIMLAEDYQKKHPKAPWEESMEYVCGEGSDEDEEITN